MSERLKLIFVFVWYLFRNTVYALGGLTAAGFAIALFAKFVLWIPDLWFIGAVGLWVVGSILYLLYLAIREMIRSSLDAAKNYIWEKKNEHS